MTWLKWLLTHPFLLILGGEDDKEAESGASAEDSNSDSSDSESEDDSENNADDSDDTSSGDEDSAEDEDEEDVFFNPDEIKDPKLKAQWKKMQAEYTKKTQNISSLKKRAEALDVLKANPKFQTWFKNAVEEEKAELEGRRPSGKATKKEATDNVMEAVESALAKRLKPVEDFIARNQRRELASMLESEKKLLSEIHPGWERHKDAIDTVMDKYQRQISLGDAHAIAMFPKVWKIAKKIMAKREAAKVQQRKNSNISKSSNNNVGITSKKGERGFSSIKEAAEAAFEELAGERR